MNIKKLLESALIFMGLLMLSRLIFVLLYVPSDAIYTYSSDIPKAIFNALRFDAQVAAYIMVPPALIYTFISIYTMFNTQTKFGKYIVILLRIWLTFAAIIVMIISIIDLGFFHNFGSHINITFFDFFNENPISLVITILTDYPIVWILLTTTIIGITVYYVSCRLVKERVVKKPAHITRHLFTLIVYLACMFICMRGSIGLYPLQIEDTIVSAGKHINNMIPNGLYMLKHAWRDKKRSFEIKTEQQLLEEYGFKSVSEALEVFGHGDNIHDALFCITPDTIRSEQPNIVLIIAESWSNWLMDIDESLVGDMRKHIEEDITFRHFQSVCNGTIGTIERITIGTPFPRVFSSKFRFKPMPTSIALPFNNSGYKTIFMTGMDQAWENCNEALLTQGFGDIIGKYELQHQHPEYKNNHVGVYDHHLMDALLEQLQNNDSKKPLFIMTVTTTNHPPFEMPDDITLAPINPKIFTMNHWSEKPKVLKKYLQGYQYENYALANFLEKLKQSTCATNTVVFITGDHNVRTIFKYETEEDFRWRNSVPLYIYIPDKWKKNIGKVDKDTWGDHYDLIPTIAPFAFRGTEYTCFGKNLLQANIPNTNNYSYNEMQILSDNEHRNISERKAIARELLIKIYFNKLLSE